MNPERITAPDGWTATADLEHYEDRFDMSDNYFGDLDTRIDEGLFDLRDVVAKGCRFFEGQRFVSAAWCSDKDLCLDGLLNRLESYIFQFAETEAYRCRFQANIELCRWVLLEHERISGERLLQGERMWLYPLSELADWIVTAAMNLQASLECEHRDYPRSSDGIQ